MSTSMSDVQGSLKEALYETLTGILSPHRDIRQAAEQRIQALEVTEEFGIHLTEFVIDPHGHLPIRQLASILLKQYVETHWTSLAEKFRPPELKQVTKERIKELLPLGLCESISKVRTAVAYAISGIAHWDWPENWSGLFDILVNCLSGESEYAVHGAMRVLTEFTRDLTDTQLPNVGPVILQEMYRIFQSESQYSIRTRGRAVEIFTIITNLVAATGIYHKGFIEQYLQPVIPMFCEKFVQCLRVANGPTSDSGLKTDIIKAINCLVTKLPKYVSNFLPQMLPPVWETLTESAKIYQEETVNGTTETNNKEVDSDGEIINFNNLIIAIFEFVHSIIEHKKFSNLVNNLLQEIIYYLIIFMQITDEQIELWTTNPNQFVEEDDQCLFAYNVRISAQEFLAGVISHFEERAVNALCEAITRHIEATNRLQAGGDDNSSIENWWKIHESSILTLSITRDVVIEKQQEGLLQFDIIRFMDTVVLNNLNDSNAPPLLLGRCLCVGGRYAQLMPPEMSSRFLEATVNGLQENQPSCIRISAVKAIYWFCEISCADANNPTNNIIRSHLPNIFQGLFNLSSQASTEVLILVMETFQTVISLDKAFTASVENKICPLTIAVFLKFHSDPVILDLCQNIFKELTQNSNCIEPLQTRLIPTLVSMMAITPMDKSKDEGARGVALDILQVLVQYSPRPLSNALIETAFPAACHCILNSEDNGTLQSGGEVIRTYLSVAARHVTTHRDSDGQTGLQYILQIIAQLLNPQSSEFTAIFVGRLVTTLIRNVGSTLGENLDLLLKAVLSKMQRAETLTVMQSLIMIYAHLINTEFDAVLNFLSTVPGPTGQSALAFVLSEWVSRQHLFFGRYERKVATVALCKILEHGVTHDDSRLNEITVKGDQIFSGNEAGVRTRSKAEAQPFQWTTVPVLIKIFKLIINELSNDIEVINATQESEVSDDDDDDTEGNETLIDPGNESTRALSSLQASSDRREETERQLRGQLEKELREGGGGGGNSNEQSSNGETIADLKRRLRERDEKIMSLEGDVTKWEQRYLEESALRQAAIDAASLPKDAKIAALEKTSQDAEKLIAEARSEKIRHMDEVHAAQKKLTDLESRMKDLESKLAERDAMIRVLQKHTYDKDNSSSSGVGSYPAAHSSHSSTSADHHTALTSTPELVSSVLGTGSGYGSTGSYGVTDSYKYRKQGSFEQTNKSLDDQLKELDSQLLSKRALCCFPGFSNPGTASRKGKIPKPLLAGVDSTGSSSTASSKSRLLDDSGGEASAGIMEFATASTRLKGTVSRLSDGKPEEMLLLEKQGRSSQRQRMQEGEPRRAGSLPPSSLPRPPRSLKSTNSRYCRLSDTETRKKSDPGPVLDSSIGKGRDSGNCTLEYGRFDAKSQRRKKSPGTDSYAQNSSLKKPSSTSGHEYERLQGDSDRKKLTTGNDVKHRDGQNRSLIPPPSRRIGEYGRLSDGDASASSKGALRKQTGSRGQSTGSTVSSKSGGRDSGGTASSETSISSLSPIKARSIPRPANYRIQF